MWVGGDDCLNRGLSRMTQMTRILRVPAVPVSSVGASCDRETHNECCLKRKVDDGVQVVRRFGAKRWVVLLLSYLDLTR